MPHPEPLIKEPNRGAASNFVHCVSDRPTRMTSYGGAFVFSGLLLVLLSSCVFAEVAPFESCPPADGPSLCTIHELRVDPCLEASQKKPCRIKRGRNASISFDFTTNFPADTLEGQAYWTNNVIDLPFIGMERDACLGTTCPVVSDQRQTYSLTLPISKSYPLRTYDVKWKLLNTQGQECCFIFQIKIHK